MYFCGGSEFCMNLITHLGTGRRLQIAVSGSVVDYWVCCSSSCTDDYCLRLRSHLCPGLWNRYGDESSCLSRALALARHIPVGPCSWSSAGGVPRDLRNRG